MIDSRLVTSQVWLITGSQSMYGPDILDQVADQSRQIAELLDGSAEVPVEIRWLPVVTDSDQIARVLSDANTSEECIGVIAWMHTFSPAKMWIRGLKTSPKAAAAPAYSVRRRAAVAQHRHGLHEPEPGRARRPRVRLHPVAAVDVTQDDRRPRERPEHPRADRIVGARGARTGRDVDHARRPIR